MKNIQGDVIGIFDSNYNIIAKYDMIHLETFYQ